MAEFRRHLLSKSMSNSFNIEPAATLALPERVGFANVHPSLMPIRTPFWMEREPNSLCESNLVRELFISPFAVCITMIIAKLMKDGQFS